MSKLLNLRYETSSKNNNREQQKQRHNNKRRSTQITITRDRIPNSGWEEHLCNSLTGQMELEWVIWH